jgi:hypothetical protein
MIKERGLPKCMTLGGKNYWGSFSPSLHLGNTGLCSQILKPILHCVMFPWYLTEASNGAGFKTPSQKCMCTCARAHTHTHTHTYCPLSYSLANSTQSLQSLTPWKQENLLRLIMNSPKSIIMESFLCQSLLRTDFSYTKEFGTQETIILFQFLPSVSEDCLDTQKQRNSFPSLPGSLM